MSETLSDEQYIEVLAPLWRSAGKMVGRRETVRAFEGLSRRIKETLGTHTAEPLHAATEILLFAENGKVVDWRSMRTLASRRVDHGSIYESVLDYMGVDPMDRAGHTGEYSPDPDHRRVYCTIDHEVREGGTFVHAVTLVAGWLASRPADKKRKRDLRRSDLASDAAEYVKNAFKSDFWRTDRALTSDEVKEALRHKAKVIEQDLLADRGFVEQLRQVFKGAQRKLGEIRWFYSLRRDGLYEVEPEAVRDWLDDESDTDIADVKSSLRHLCRASGLQEVSNAVGSSEADGMYITAPRLSVRLSDDGLGYDVFIPAYYSFGHIHNLREKDFAPLRAAMDTLSDYGRLQRGAAATTRLARNAYREHRKGSRDGREASDKARIPLGLERRTMRSRVSSAADPFDSTGRQPKKTGSPPSTKIDDLRKDDPPSHDRLH